MQVPYAIKKVMYILVNLMDFVTIACFFQNSKKIKCNSGKLNNDIHPVPLKSCGVFVKISWIYHHNKFSQNNNKTKLMAFF